jgi:flagellar hook-basal body complex protein FliE
MSTPFNAATAAYGNVSRLISQTAAPGNAIPVKQDDKNDFAKLLSESLQGLVDSGKASEQKSMDLVNGKGDIVDVVTAISQTEIAMETMVTVRDRVISAYEEIMRMPI